MLSLRFRFGIELELILKIQELLGQKAEDFTDIGDMAASLAEMYNATAKPEFPRMQSWIKEYNLGETVPPNEFIDWRLTQDLSLENSPRSTCK